VTKGRDFPFCNKLSNFFDTFDSVVCKCYPEIFVVS